MSHHSRAHDLCVDGKSSEDPIYIWWNCLLTILVLILIMVTVIDQIYDRTIGT
jgi:hypothetical protein